LRYGLNAGRGVPDATGPSDRGRGRPAGADHLDLILGVAEYQKDRKSVSVATLGKDWFAVVEREINLGHGS
jgi:hypothetical protein